MVRQLDQSRGLAWGRFKKRTGVLMRRDQRIDLGPESGVVRTRGVKKGRAVSRRNLQGTMEQIDGGVHAEELPCISRSSQALANVQ